MSITIFLPQDPLDRPRLGYPGDPPDVKSNHPRAMLAFTPGARAEVGAVGGSRLLKRSAERGGRSFPPPGTLSFPHPRPSFPRRARRRLFGTDTQRGVLTGLSRERNLRSKI